MYERPALTFDGRGPYAPVCIDPLHACHEHGSHVRCRSCGDCDFYCTCTTEALRDFQDGEAAFEDTRPRVRLEDDDPLSTPYYDERLAWAGATVQYA